MTEKVLEVWLLKKTVSSVLDTLTWPRRYFQFVTVKET